MGGGRKRTRSPRRLVPMYGQKKQTATALSGSARRISVLGRLLAWHTSWQLCLEEKKKKSGGPARDGWQQARSYTLRQVPGRRKFSARRKGQDTTCASPRPEAADRRLHHLHENNPIYIDLWPREETGVNPCSTSDASDTKKKWEGVGVRLRGWLGDRSRISHHKDGHERGRLREEGAETVPAAKPADHRQPEKEIVHPGHDVGVHVSQTTDFRTDPGKADTRGRRHEMRKKNEVRTGRPEVRERLTLLKTFLSYHGAHDEDHRGRRGQPLPPHGVLPPRRAIAEETSMIGSVIHQLFFCSIDRPKERDKPATARLKRLRNASNAGKGTHLMW